MFKKQSESICSLANKRGHELQFPCGRIPKYDWVVGSGAPSAAESGCEPRLIPSDK